MLRGEEAGRGLCRYFISSLKNASNPWRGRYVIISMGVKMKATTIRIPEEKLRLLRSIAGFEGRSMSKIIEELIDEYLEKHRETLELLNIDGLFEKIKEAERQIKKGEVVSISELEGSIRKRGS